MSLPLYRQEKEWLQYGLELSRKTMANWIIRSSHYWLEPLYECLRLELNNQEAIHADEPHYQILNRPDGRPASSDARSNIDEILSFYNGYLHCDGYSAYQNTPNLKVVACWANVRRKFFEEGDERGMAAIGKNYCDRLFILEQQFKNLPTDMRKAYRQLKSKPLLAEFWEWLGSFPVIAKSKLGRTIAYARI